MASERDPKTPRPAGAPPSPFAPAVNPFGQNPFAPAPLPLPPPETGGTMVGMAPISAAAAPPPASDDSGQTVIGMRRLPAPPANVPAGPAPMPSPIRAFGGGAVPAPNFGQYAMPMPAPAAPAADGAGGTMVGMARVGMPAPAMPSVPVPSGTMVGMAPVAAFGASAFAPQANNDAVGGTMVGINRLSLQMPAPAPVDDAAGGGTMVGIPLSRIEAPQAATFARPPGPPPAYEIIKHLGGGNLGQVFHARHRETGVEYALRIIAPEISAVAGSDDALREMVNLSQAAEHTHLGRQYDLDESASTTLVVEYVPGRLLSSLMGNRGPAPAAAVVDLGVRLCSALAAAHAAGLAHGRVHSGNVVLEAKTGRWVLMDLGHGYATSGLEPSHDLYALAALLYEMATSHPPFESGEPSAPDPRSHVPNLPATLSALLVRALSPDQSVWFPSAGDMVQALARARGAG